MIERFDLCEVYHVGEVECEMRAKPTGEYVRYRDYQELEKQLLEQQRECASVRRAYLREKSLREAGNV